VKLSRWILWLLLVVLISPSLFARTWYARRDGGTRYSINVTSGQCDGKTDAPYSGKGVNQLCAYEMLYNTKDGFIGPHTWTTTLVIGSEQIISPQQVRRSSRTVLHG
jgi:hypothetical protein